MADFCSHVRSSRQQMLPQKIAFFGVQLESNNFAPPTTKTDFTSGRYFSGQDILVEAKNSPNKLPGELCGFLGQFSSINETWTPVPVLVTGATPGGPADSLFISEIFDQICFDLKKNLPLDGIFICNHGAMTTTASTDADGELFQRVREIVGADVPIVGTLDLHANVSEAMVSNVNVLIPYYTNPHVDQRERGEEAARTLHFLLNKQIELVPTFIKLPLVIPSVCLLTTENGPFSEWMRLGQQEKGVDVPIVGLIPGFAWSDSKKNGMVILTYSNIMLDSTNRSKKLATFLANKIWTERNRIIVSLTSLTDAVHKAILAQQEFSSRIILADVADNPGGGGRADVLDIFKALYFADVSKVLMGNFCLPELARKCHEFGAPHLVFKHRMADDLETDLEILCLSEGLVVGKRGLTAGRTVNLGLSCAVRARGITFLATSRRVQACDPAYFEAFGLNVLDFKTIVVKSRGHFRAGYDLVVSSKDIFEELPRPVFPLDPDTVWKRDDIKQID